MRLAAVLALAVGAAAAAEPDPDFGGTCGACSKAADDDEVAAMQLRKTSGAPPPAPPPPRQQQQQQQPSSPLGACTDPREITGLDQMLNGYNIYKGNPYSVDGADPGFLDTYIFNFDYSPGRNTTYGPDCILVPETVGFSDQPFCTISTYSTESDTSSEYSDTFKIVVKSDLKFPSGSFTASTGYSDFKKSTETEHQQRSSFYMECKQYRASISRLALPAFHPQFQAAMEGLSSTPDDFYELFDAFGTHYISEVSLGARYGRVVYLTEAGVDELRKHDLTVEAGAKYAGDFTFNLDTKTDLAKTSHDIFEDKSASSWQISWGQPPKTDATGWDAEWVKETRLEPAAISYKVSSLCDVFREPDMKTVCLAAEGTYCEARIDAWRSDGFPDAACEPSTTTTTTTPGVDCHGCPSEGCCLGGCPAMPGTSELRNEVAFSGTQGLPEATRPHLAVTGCAVAESQPWGQPVSDQHAPNQALDSTHDSIIVYAGRWGQNWIAKDFAGGLQASNMLGVRKNEVGLPDELNFFVEGDLEFRFRQPYHTIPGIRLGMDQNNRWWIGGPTCANYDGENLKCKATDGRAFMFWALSDWQFHVAYA